MATTRLIKHFARKGMTVAQTLKDIFDYGKNHEKTGGGELLQSFECDHETADAEFALAKAEYFAKTAREQEGSKDVICYQIRQSFKPGEVTPEQANAIGFDLAKRWTKGRHAFFVATHIDKNHIHNHIYYNSTTLDCKHKFRDFIGSVRALRRLSDRISLENNLSVITNPKLRSQAEYRHYGEWLKAQSKRKNISLVVDIQQKMHEGKGPAYARWATLHNLKQMAAAMQFLQENKLLSYEDLQAKAEQSTDHYHDIGDKLKQTEAAMKRNAELKKLILEYARTRPIFEEYKARKYSKKFLSEHEADIAIHRATQASMKELLQGEKLPKMEALKSEWQDLKREKGSGYADYRLAQKEMREIVTVKANIDQLLGLTNEAKNKEQER
jgi:hypothetical protein